MRWNIAVWLLAVALLPGAARADVRPAALVSDGMVLQQKRDDKIWGTADPGEEITVSFRGKQATTKADAQGNWAVAIPAGDAGGPFQLTIAGKNKVEIDNVLVGEVWVASGQSNMEWSINQSDKTDKEAAFSAPRNPKLRIFQVEKRPTARPRAKTTGKWVEADPKELGRMTAAGYFFGRKLQEELNVPVGIIQSAWGGTRAEAWTSAETLAGNPLYQTEVATFKKATADQDPEKPVNPNAPSALYNGMLRPLLHYGIKGAIWYQGESNVGKAYAYRELFPTMIKNWRQDWHQGDFPFYFVQLAPFLAVKKEPGESAWAELREAQLLTLKLDNTGMAVITDYGHEMDIHPTPKRPVGERLALIALAKDYGKKVEYSGPAYKDLKIEGNKAVLTFDHVGGGLVAKELVPTDTRKNPKSGQTGSAWRVKEGSEGAELQGFTVAGKDYRFHPAKAVIVGNTVVVTSDVVADPVAVRYGWADHPVINLFNRAGLPASPFRTDTRPGVTAPKR